MVWSVEEKNVRLIKGFISIHLQIRAHVKWIRCRASRAFTSCEIFDRKENIAELKEKLENHESLVGLKSLLLLYSS